MKLNHIQKQDLNKVTKDEIYKYIQSMDTEKTTKLPREETLAEQLGVSRITVRNALSQLAAEGIILRKHGKGTFVNVEATQIKVNFSPAEDFRNVIINSGYHVDVKIEKISEREANADEAQKLNLSPKTKLIVIEKMFFADEFPAVYCVDRIPLELYNGKINKHDLSKPLFQLIREKLNKEIIWDKVELVTTTNEEQPFLNKFFNTEKVKSFLNCNVINFDEDDQPTVYSNEYIDTNFIRFNLIRQKA